jgi:hypothetical protein
MEPVIGGVYRHYKGPSYLVLGVVTHSETLEEMVYYACLYPNPNGQFWVRPKAMFMGSIEQDGQQVPRFRYVDAPA